MTVIIILYIATAAIFLVVDYFGLSYLIQPAFKRDIGHLMLENFRVGPAALFYAFFVAVLLWFVSWPAIVEDKSLLWVFFNAALIGAAAYGTFDFTALAILKDYTLRIAILDTVWGTALTGVAATGGVLAARALT